MVQLHVERTIAASPERVFEWLADPASLKVTGLRPSLFERHEA
jgi:hypothetical protein